MQFDREEQRSNVLACIRVASASIRFDASEETFMQCAAYVQLRREVEAATITPAQEASTEPTEATHG